MTIDLTTKLSGAIELLLESHSRINEAKPQHYWYPLSMATYGVEEIIEALDSMCRFRTTMWEKTRKFEGYFAEYQGTKAAVMVNSGSSADLLLSFLLTGAPLHRMARGDEILIPAVTWPTQIWSAMMAGFTVRLVDVDPETLNVSLEDLVRKVTPKTKCLFLVHLLGNPCEMDKILEVAKNRNLIVLEDCCEALGSEWNGTKVGNFGLGASFSFFFAHHMTTMEGGMITTNSEEAAESLRILRAHGWLRNVVDPSRYGIVGPDIDPRYAFANWGFNVRPTELQAGFGLHQIVKLPQFNRRREVLADRFFAFIDKSRFLSRPKVSYLARPAWMALPVLLAEDSPFKRSELTRYLENEGVETRPIVTGNIARQPVAKLFKEFSDSPLPGADVVHERGFYIGLSPIVPDAAMDRLLECFESFLKRF
jgi:dTDP-4-amino-4,6-dideoxygalactose transaminase